MPGSRRSSSTTAGRMRRTAARPAGPSRAVVTFSAAPPRYAVSRSSDGRSSSMITTSPSVAAPAAPSWTTSSPATRSENPKVLPTPTSLSSHIRPPSSSTIRRDSVSPSPVPSSLAAPRPPCWNDSKMRSVSSVATPTPVSVTRDRELGSRPLRTDRDRAPVAGELHGVADQVDQHLFESQPVGVHGLNTGPDRPARRSIAWRESPLPHQCNGVVDQGRRARRWSTRSPFAPPPPSTGRGSR